MRIAAMKCAQAILAALVFISRPMLLPSLLQQQLMPFAVMLTSPAGAAATLTPTKM